MKVKIEYAKNPVLRKGIELARITEEIGKTQVKKNPDQDLADVTHHTIGGMGIK